MRRINKLYEARAIVSQARSKIILGLNSMKFNKADRAKLSPICNEGVSKELDKLVDALDALIEESLGITEQGRWDAAARNLNLKRGAQ